MITQYELDKVSEYCNKHMHELTNSISDGRFDALIVAKDVITKCKLNYSSTVEIGREILHILGQTRSYNSLLNYPPAPTVFNKRDKKDVAFYIFFRSFDYDKVLLKVEYCMPAGVYDGMRIDDGEIGGLFYIPIDIDANCVASIMNYHLGQFFNASRVYYTAVKPEETFKGFTIKKDDPQFQYIKDNAKHVMNELYHATMMDIEYFMEGGADHLKLDYDRWLKCGREKLVDVDVLSGYINLLDGDRLKEVGLMRELCQDLMNAKDKDLEKLVTVAYFKRYGKVLVNSAAVQKNEIVSTAKKILRDEIGVVD